MSDRQFCAHINRESEEPLIGTASYSPRLVLVSWPKSKWPQKSIQADEFIPLQDWASEHVACTGQKAVVRLICRPDMDSQEIEVRIYPEGTLYKLSSIKEVVEQLRMHMDLGPTDGSEQAAPLLAICTHGKHDTCCAKEGQGLFNALCELSKSGSLKREVWQSTHLGGHRFAATMIDLPSGNMYGRLEETQAETICAAINNDSTDHDYLRGNIYLDAATQIVQATAQKRWPEAELHVEPPEPGMEKRKNKYLVFDRRTGACIDITLKEVEFVGPTSCKELEAPKTYTRPVLESILEL